MKELRIRTFGGPVLHRDNVRLPPFPTRKSESLFGYLLIHRDRRVHRDVLCGALWGDQTDAEARKALRTALWRIRSILEPEPADRGSVLMAQHDHVGLARSGNLWVDAWELEDCVRNNRGVATPLDAQGAHRLEAAVRLYRGDFLEPHDDEWCYLHREQLKRTFLAAVEMLHKHCRARGDWVSAISWAHLLLRHDPLREDIHRGVMACHLAMGDRPSALRHYSTCVRVLRDEMDIAPMEETRQLHERIRQNECESDWPGLSVGLNLGFRAADPEGLLKEVEGALRELRGLTDRLERTRALLGHDSAVAP